MKNRPIRPLSAVSLGFGFIFAIVATVSVSSLAGNRAPSEAGPQLIQPAELVKLLQAPQSRQPLILQVGFRTLYEQAHIPGSEYIGPTSEQAGLQELHKRVQALPRSRSIVLYCGCCPWSHCPNVHPAYQELREMGFLNVRVLYIANNFGVDWVDKGYPVSKGK